MIHSKKIASSAKHPQLKRQESVLALIQLKKRVYDNNDIHTLTFYYYFNRLHDQNKVHDL